MTGRTALGLLLLGAGAITSANLRSALGAEALSWEAALQETVRNNPSLRSARASLQASQYQAREAQSGYFPQVNGALNSNYGETSTDSRASGATTTYSASLTATENLFNGLQTRGTVAQAEAAVRVSEAGLRTAQARVSYDLKTGYMGLVYAQESLRLAGDITRRRAENLRLVELRFENGNENKGSVMLSRAYLKEAQFGELQARNALQLARKQLAQVLGRDQIDELQAIGRVPVSEPMPGVDLKRLAVETPDHQQAVAQEDSAQAAFTVARAPFFPTLSLVGTTGRTGDTFFPDTTRNWSVGLNLTYPLFSGGKDYFATRAASENLTSAMYNRENVDRGLLARLEQAYNAFVEAVERLKVDQTFLEAATVREKIGKSKYNNGLLTFENWDIIESDLIKRQSAALQSERDRVTAEAAWEQAQGKGVVQ